MEVCVEVSVRGSMFGSGSLRFCVILWMFVCESVMFCESVCQVLCLGQWVLVCGSMRFYVCVCEVLCGSVCMDLYVSLCVCVCVCV